MKKLIIPLSLLAPFIIITFYFVIDKYIYWLFDVKDQYVATFISLMLTMLSIFGVGVWFINKEDGRE